MPLGVRVQHDTSRRAEQERWVLSGGTGQVYRGSPHAYLISLSSPSDFSRTAQSMAATKPPGCSGCTRSISWRTYSWMQTVTCSLRFCVWFLKRWYGLRSARSSRLSFSRGHSRKALLGEDGCLSAIVDRAIHALRIGDFS